VHGQHAVETSTCITQNGSSELLSSTSVWTGTLKYHMKNQKSFSSRPPSISSPPRSCRRINYSFSNIIITSYDNIRPSTGNLFTKCPGTNNNTILLYYHTDFEHYNIPYTRFNFGVNPSRDCYNHNNMFIGHKLVPDYTLRPRRVIRRDERIIVNRGACDIINTRHVIVFFGLQRQ